jgi:hypothetical protein
MTRLHGVIAEFRDAPALVAALRAAKQAGFARMDAFAPFPVPEAAEILGDNGARVAWIAIGAGLFGAALAYSTQWWLSVHLYPLDVGGRPLHAWPAFLPATTIVAILWAAAAALVGMLVLNRLPRLSHPVFAVPSFDHASEDAFFLLIESDGPRFDARDAARFLSRQGARRVEEVAA